MSLATHTPIGFIPVTNFVAARAFYENTLGLTFESDDGFALVFRVGPTGTMLRLVLVDNFTPVPFTIFGWEAGNIHSLVGELTDRGVDFLRYTGLPQSTDGVWTAPGGAQVAWFKDVDGNTLSLSHHPA